MENSIGKRVKSIRKAKNMTQLQLAECAYISESYLALIELNKRNPSTDVLIKLSEALGVSSDYLLFGNLPHNEMTLFNEWKSLVSGRTLDQIKSAQDIVKIFFNQLDKNDNKTN